MELLANSKEEELKGEAVWVLANCTSNATVEQSKYLVQEGAFLAFNSVLDCQDAQTLIVTMEGISFLLKKGKEHCLDEQGQNIFAQVAESCGILDKLEQL
jgi:hypothetical protein